MSIFFILTHFRLSFNLAVLTNVSKFYFTWMKNCLIVFNAGVIGAVVYSGQENVGR